VGFPFNVYLAALASAGIASAATLPFWRWFCRKTGLMDDPGHRKIHEEVTPLAGGLAVMTGLLLPTLGAVLLLWWHRSSPSAASVPGRDGLDANAFFLLQYGLRHRALELAGILIGALGMLVVGCLDDKYELRPSVKFGGQLLIAGLVAASGARITLFVPNPVFHYAITILWFLTCINAFNFMDNMNGLCAGLGAIGAGYFAVLAAADGQYLVASIALLTFGALLGFLPYNFPRAVAFLGDSGSHLIGYLLAVLAILPHFYTSLNPRKWAVLIPLLVLAVPLLDLVWVVLLRTLNGQPFYIGDTNHLSHRLVRRGMTRRQAVLAIWGLAAVLGALACIM
jgi:UDP-GlcNAc:undecaprenyl-phosphate/decaprenyl-phosphate GlcNAc-1-phosphate transferase